MNQFKFLLVEDEKVAQIIVRHIIEDAGYSVDIASSAKQSLELLQDNKYDLIFLDFSLPDGSGVELSKQLRSMGLTVPIVAITAYDASLKEQECIESGYSGYIEKPLTQEKLQETIEQFLTVNCAILS